MKTTSMLDILKEWIGEKLKENTPLPKKIEKPQTPEILPGIKPGSPSTTPAPKRRTLEPPKTAPKTSPKAEGIDQIERKLGKKYFNLKKGK